MSFTPDVLTTEEALASILESPLPALPPQEQRYGSTLVSWWETDPGEVYVHAEGGTADDRHYASTLIALQLQPHGYRRAQFDMDEKDKGGHRVSGPPYFRLTSPHQSGTYRTRTRLSQPSHVMDQFSRGQSKAAVHKTASWPDLMAKAKRLVQSGQVQLLRNGFNQIMAHVVGDHGEYDCEISRDDPQTRSITGWQCTCPWDQYAWQRTRKWKKFEGRPCAHVLAAYWAGLSAPLDEQLTEEQAMGLGTGQRLPGDQMIGPRAPVPHVPGGPSGPRVFGPEGPEQGKQMQMNLPPDALGGPPGPAQAPIAPPPGNGGPGGPSGPEPPGVIPPFPGEQQQLPWAGPGTTPGGMESPPGAMSLPGAKPPNPFNPIQNPGTYSKVAMELPDEAWKEWWNPGDQAHFEYHCYRGHDSSDADLWYRSHQPVTVQGIHPEGEYADATAGLPDTMNDRFDRGMPASYLVKFPDGLEKATFEDELLTHPRYFAPDGGPPPLDEIRQYEPDFQAHSQQRFAKVAADFNPPETVRFKKPVLGIAEGPVQGQYGDGEYRENEDPSGEVISQDPSTGWVEVISPLHSSGPHEPYHIRCYVEPSDIEKSDSTNAFIKRHAKINKMTTDWDEAIMDPKWDRYFETQEHDYDPRGEYDLRSDQMGHPLHQLAQQRMDELAQHPDTLFERGHVFPARLDAAHNPSGQDALGVYASGTYTEPMVMVDIDAHQTPDVDSPEDEMRRTVDHEVAHATQENNHDSPEVWQGNEDEAEGWKW